MKTRLERMSEGPADTRIKRHYSRLRITTLDGNVYSFDAKISMCTSDSLVPPWRDFIDWFTVGHDSTYTFKRPTQPVFHTYARSNIVKYTIGLNTKFEEPEDE